MGRIAVYISIGEKPLEALWKLSDQAFRERFLEIEEDDSLDRLNIDKIWDALHCTMTGVTASNPIEDNKLSESIVGVYPKIYDDEDYSMFVSVIENEDIEGILSALEGIDKDWLTTALDPAQLKGQRVYPKGIWNDSPESLVAEMDSALEEIRTFFRRSRAHGKHILATIL